MMEVFWGGLRLYEEYKVSLCVCMCRYVYMYVKESQKSMLYFAWLKKIPMKLCTNPKCKDRFYNQTCTFTYISYEIFHCYINEHEITMLSLMAFHFLNLRKRAVRLTYHIHQ